MFAECTYDVAKSNDMDNYVMWHGQLLYATWSKLLVRTRDSYRRIVRVERHIADQNKLHVGPSGTRRAYVCLSLKY